MLRPLVSIISMVVIITTIRNHHRHHHHTTTTILGLGDHHHHIIALSSLMVSWPRPLGPRPKIHLILGPRQIFYIVSGPKPFGFKPLFSYWPFLSYDLLEQSIDPWVACQSVCHACAAARSEHADSKTKDSRRAPAQKRAPMTLRGVHSRVGLRLTSEASEASEAS